MFADRSSLWPISSNAFICYRIIIPQVAVTVGGGGRHLRSLQKSREKV